MNDVFCPDCRLEQPLGHRFCFRCGIELPTHLLDSGPPKTARFFAGVRVRDEDPEDGFLRVSCYHRDQTVESPEGRVTIPGEHVRFSIWVGSEARCVLSIPGSEARELASFLSGELTSLRQTTPSA